MMGEHVRKLATDLPVAAACIASPWALHAVEAGTAVLSLAAAALGCALAYVRLKAALRDLHKGSKP